MKQRWKKEVAVIMAIAMLGCSVSLITHAEGTQTYAAAGAGSPDGVQAQTDIAQAYSANALQPEMEKNLNYQNYGIYGAMVSSYLVETEGGYMRVQQVKEKKAPIVEYYNEQFQLQSQKYIDKELDGFAGFYAGNDYYYIAWAQFLPPGVYAEDKPFLRVTKYDKDWNRLACGEIASQDIKDRNGVAYLGQSGSLRMSEHQGHLYINTCDEGIDTHQKSQVYDITVEDMTFVKLPANSVTAHYGSASHSFNQFLLIDDGLEPARVVTLNQGDNPDTGKRGAALEQCVLYTEYPSAVSSSGKKLVNALPAAGGDYRTESGNVNNFVGMSLGGLEQSQTSYLIAGNSIEQEDETFLTAKQRNIFVTATSRTDFTEENTALTWLTDYQEGDGIEISTPQLVKMNENLFLVMWRVGAWADHIAGELNYTFVDGNGNRCSGALGETKTAKAEITDCKPIVKDGRAVWYSSGAEGVYFYSIDAQGSFTRHGVNTMEEIPTLTKVEMREDGMYFAWEPVEHAAGYRIIRRYETEAGEDFCRDVEGGQTSQYLDTKTDFEDDCSFDYFVCALDENGMPSYASNVINQWVFRGLYKSQVSLENVAEGVKVSWNTLPDVEFRIYRSTADQADEELIATVKGPASEDYTLGEVQTYTDKTAKSGVPYDYSISVYSGGHESARFNKHSIIYLPNPKVSAQCTVHDSRNTVTLSWDEVPGAAEYTVAAQVWDDASGRYGSVNMEKSFSDDKLSCVVYGASEGKKYRFTVGAESETIQTSSMQYSNSFRGEMSEVELTYVKPAVTPTPTPGTTPTPTPTPVTALQTPLFTTMQSTSEGVKLAWNPVEGADGYTILVYVNNNDTKDWRETIDLTGKEHEYVDTKAAEGVDYIYRIRAFAQNGEKIIYSSFSAEQNMKYQNPASTGSPTASSTTSPTAKPTAVPTIKPTVTPTPIPTSTGKPPGPVTSPEASERPSFIPYLSEIPVSELPSSGAPVSEAPSSGTPVSETPSSGMPVSEAPSSGTPVSETPSSGIPVTGPLLSKAPQPVPSPGTTAPGEKLTAPGQMTVQCVRDGVKIAWESIYGADGYFIRYYNVKNPEGIQTYKLENPDAVSYVHPHGIEGETYVYSVAAYRNTPSFEIGEYTEGQSILYQKADDEQSVSLGDVDGNGKVDLKDAQLALKAALNLLQLSDEQQPRADVDGEPGVKLKDAQLILKAALNLIVLGK